MEGVFCQLLENLLNFSILYLLIYTTFHLLIFYHALSTVSRGIGKIFFLSAFYVLHSKIKAEVTIVLVS